MFAALLAAVLIVGCTHGSPMANQYVDSVLNTALQNEIRLLNLDPASLPNFTTNFEDKVLGIKVKGTADYSRGNLTGLSRVRRYSECQGPYYSFGVKHVNCSIVFDMLSINYDGKVKYGKVPSVNVHANSNLTTNVVFVEFSQNPPMQPFVQVFAYQHTGYQQIKHTGLGPLNKYMKVLDDGFRGHVQANVYNSVSQRFQTALNRAAALVPLPN